MSHPKQPVTARCAVCHGRMPDATDLYACEACGYRLRCMLRELPKHVPLLEALLRPGSGLPGRGGAGRAHSPMPVRPDVLDLLGPGHVVVLEDPHGDQSAGVPITPLLYGWARYIAYNHPAVGRDRHGTVQVQPCDGAHSRGGTVAAWCSWLIAYLPYAVTQPWVDEMYRQLEELLDRVRAKTGTRPGRSRKDAPCPACSCFALVETDGEWHIMCEACAHKLTRAEYARHHAAVVPALAAIAVRIALQQQSARAEEAEHAAA